LANANRLFLLNKKILSNPLEGKNRRSHIIDRRTPLSGPANLGGALKAP
jgi:hypothetical protein